MQLNDVRLEGDTQLNEVRHKANPPLNDARSAIATSVKHNTLRKQLDVNCSRNPTPNQRVILALSLPPPPSPGGLNFLKNIFCNPNTNLFLANERTLFQLGVQSPHCHLNLVTDLLCSLFGCVCVKCARVYVWMCVYVCG